MNRICQLCERIFTFYKLISMKHHQYNSGYKFVKDPVDFNKYTDRSLLQYCLGATMYMPGTKDFAQAVIDKKYPGLTSMVMCFEDACPEEDVPAAVAKKEM